MNDLIQDKIYLSQNKVLFVTNSIGLPGSTLVSSLKSYIDYIPIHNFCFLPGYYKGNQCYGFDAFLYMLTMTYSPEHPLYNFNYIIYIDDDCFITDFHVLVEEFKKFRDSGCCIAGISDGGQICHRNHKKELVNTFLSFWNLKILKDNTDLQSIYDYCKEHLNPETAYKDFYDLMHTDEDRMRIFNDMIYKSDYICDKVKEYRKINFLNGESPYSDIVRNDPDNPVEMHQIPYSYEDYDVSSNAEPYYLLEEAIIYLTKTRPYYLLAADYHSKEHSDTDDDNSGLSTAVYTDNFNKMIAIHTWFSRAYSKWPKTDVMRKHTDRINKIIEKYTKL